MHAPTTWAMYPNHSSSATVTPFLSWIDSWFLNAQKLPGLISITFPLGVKRPCTTWQGLPRNSNVILRNHHISLHLISPSEHEAPSSLLRLAPYLNFSTCDIRLKVIISRYRHHSAAAIPSFLSGNAASKTLVLTYHIPYTSSSSRTPASCLPTFLQTNAPSLSINR